MNDLSGIPQRLHIHVPKMRAPTCTYSTVTRDICWLRTSTDLICPKSSKASLTVSLAAILDKCPTQSVVLHTEVKERVEWGEQEGEMKGWRKRERVGEKEREMG